MVLSTVSIKAVTKIIADWSDLFNINSLEIGKKCTRSFQYLVPYISLIICQVLKFTIEQKQRKTANPPIRKH